MIFIITISERYCKVVNFVLREISSGRGRITLEKRWYKRKTAIGLIFLFLAVCVLAGCGQGAATEEQEVESEQAEEIMRLFVNDEELPVTWEDNASVDALMELASKEPIVIDMSMYGGFEQVGSIGQDLPRDDRETAASAGDIVLYSGNQIVVFYGTNSWAYTRLGKIEGKTDEELAQLLGKNQVSLTIRIDE